jgi:F-type H+-transporting ATPase subunit delta
MAELTVEITYGKALFEAARDMNKVDIILEEMKAISAIFLQEPDFREFFNTPVLSGPEKKKVIESVFRDRISAETYNFLLILIDKRRTASFNRILKEYQRLVDQNLGISLGTIFSVEPLTDIQMNSFEEKTGNLLRKNVKLANKIEPSILGGVKIFIEGKVIDASIRKHLQDLEGRIKQA